MNSKDVCLEICLWRSFISLKGRKQLNGQLLVNKVVSISNKSRVLQHASGFSYFFVYFII